MFISAPPAANLVWIKQLLRCFPRDNTNQRYRKGFDHLYLEEKGGYLSFRHKITEGTHKVLNINRKPNLEYRKQRVDKTIC